MPLLCCHPYDVCTELIAREAGVIVTDERGQPLDAPLDIRANVSWIGYANETIRQKVEPVLLRLLAEL
jgi:fructose-1,6-bisphosphatase/inositol monophosphatase family enzyme